MKRVIFALGSLLLFACSKTDKVSPPVAVVQEESIKFTTNLDTGTYNVADTLPLVITVSSKLPSAGVVYSITTTWVDSSKQVFKLDTSLITSSLSLNIPGLKKSGNYSLSVTISSKSTPSNILNKSISVVNNPLGRFMGYKVAANAKQQGSSYWKNVPVLSDIISVIFHTPGTGHDHVGTGLNTVSGDFNGDGYIDVFCPGNIYSNNLDNDVGFLIWNSTTKKFEDKNLFNDKSQMSLIWNAQKVVPLYLNDDNYVDLVIFGYIDEGIPNFYTSDNILKYSKPVSLAISDGKGGYDLKPLVTESPIFWHTGGDVGDLNGDGIPDLVINYGPMMRIMWGVTGFPYFSNLNSATFVNDPNLNYTNNNGFGESCAECAYNAGDCVISDINKDGKNDLVLSSSEDLNSSTLGPKIPKVLINLGNGRFNKSSIINLPYYGDGTNNPMYTQNDFIIDDVNGDGRKDIIGLNEASYNTWNLYGYIQQIDGSFVIDKNLFQFSINNPRLARDWKPRMIYSDFNGDGIKDVAFIDGVAGNIHYNDALNIMIKKRSVFIRQGNQFVEQDFYQYDPYMQSLLINVK